MARSFISIVIFHERIYRILEICFKIAIISLWISTCTHLNYIFKYFLWVGEAGNFDASMLLLLSSSHISLMISRNNFTLFVNFVRDFVYMAHPKWNSHLWTLNWTTNIFCYTLLNDFLALMDKYILSNSTHSKHQKTPCTC